MTTYASAAAGYDDEHEAAALVAAITDAITRTSIVSDAAVICVRTGEAASALLTVLATISAMSPTAVRSPTSMRKMCDELHKRLRRRVSAADASEELQEFVRRAFRGNDVGGHA